MSKTKPNHMLKIENLSYSYSRKSRLIENFSMSLEQGTVCGLLGKNGAGKSTLIYLICGLLRPSTGTIDFRGYNPTDRKVGFLEDVFLVPEEFTLPGVTLDEYVKVNAPFYPAFNHEAMVRYLDIFDLTPDIHLSKLSMGQKKKAFISFAMACTTGLTNPPTASTSVPRETSARPLPSA